MSSSEHLNLTVNLSSSNSKMSWWTVFGWQADLSLWRVATQPGMPWPTVWQKATAVVWGTPPLPSPPHHQHQLCIIPFSPSPLFNPCSFVFSPRLLFPWSLHPERNRNLASKSHHLLPLPFSLVTFSLLLSLLWTGQNAIRAFAPFCQTFTAFLPCSGSWKAAPDSPLCSEHYNWNNCSLLLSYYSPWSHSLLSFLVPFLLFSLPVKQIQQ